MRIKSERSFSDIHSAAIIYLSLPLLCFFCGFLRWYYSIICCGALCAVLWHVLRSDNIETEYRRKGSFSHKTILLVFLFSMIWSYLGGMNGYYYQSPDWDCRNAIYFDLIRYDWPVIYEQNGQALVYYIGHWLPPASLAKLVQAITGSVSWGRFTGRMLLWVWSSTGLTVIILMIFQVVGAQTRKKRIAALFFYVFFSGMDIVGGVLLHRLWRIFDPSLLHLEWWCPIYQYTSMTACLFWVFNQAIIPWLITLCFVTENDPHNYVFYCVVCLLCGTLPCVGLVVLMIVKAAAYLVDSVKNAKSRAICRTVFSVQNLTAFLILFPVIVSFIITSNTVGTFTIGSRHKSASAAPVMAYEETQEGQGNSFRLQPLSLGTIEKADESEKQRYSGETLSADAAGSWRKGILSPDYLNKTLLAFLMLEVGFYLLCVFPDHWKDPIYYTILVCFFIAPYIRVGKTYDFCMRATIPAVFILMLYVNRFLLSHLSADHEEEKAPKRDNLRRAAAVFLTICFAVGALTPCVEVFRGVYNVKTKGTILLEDRSIMTFNRDHVPDNFACTNPEEHFFFKYLADK